MESRVGIRELRQNASSIVRRAAAGEVLDITDRGRAVARMGPLPTGGNHARMVAEGRVSPARGDLLGHQPLPAPPGRPLGAEALAALRIDER
ncbi:MAG: type II toxin-antitoxin system prevent-host-death family antitoxin [Candidatus Dormibacteraeota bacterium]|nr:type II toxin-antitoxin system prevent-host-death family antitoxin [Candidatus Dormibacteraeota bacterium]